MSRRRGPGPPTLRSASVTRGTRWWLCPAGDRRSLHRSRCERCGHGAGARPPAALSERDEQVSDLVGARPVAAQHDGAVDGERRRGRGAPGRRCRRVQYVFAAGRSRVSLCRARAARRSGRAARVAARRALPARRAGPHGRDRRARRRRAHTGSARWTRSSAPTCPTRSWCGRPARHAASSPECDRTPRATARTSTLDLGPRDHRSGQPSGSKTAVKWRRVPGTLRRAA